MPYQTNTLTGLENKKNEQPNKQKVIFMNKEPRQFTDFSSGQDGWGNDDQEWEEWARRTGALAPAARPGQRK